MFILITVQIPKNVHILRDVVSIKSARKIRSINLTLNCFIRIILKEILLWNVYRIGIEMNFGIGSKSTRSFYFKFNWKYNANNDEALFFKQKPRTRSCERVFSYFLVLPSFEFHLYFISFFYSNQHMLTIYIFKITICFHSNHKLSLGTGDSCYRSSVKSREWIFPFENSGMDIYGFIKKCICARNVIRQHFWFIFRFDRNNTQHRSIISLKVLAAHQRWKRTDYWNIY